MMRTFLETNKLECTGACDTGCCRGDCADCVCECFPKETVKALGVKPDAMRAAASLVEAHRRPYQDLGLCTLTRDQEERAEAAIAQADKDVSSKLGHEDDALTEEEFLRQYKRTEYPRPSVTVDLVIFTIIDNDLKMLLIKRKGHPFQGHWAMPGGFVNVGTADVDHGEDLESAAHRELEEKTGLPKGSCYLEQLYTFGEPNRDHRTRVISVAYYALVRSTLAPLVKAGGADDARWFSVSQLWETGWVEGTDDVVKPLGETKVLGSLYNATLAFDHRLVLQKAVERIQGKIDYAPIAFDLVPETFTVSDLMSVYEVVKGKNFRETTFRKKFNRMLEDGIIEKASGKRSTGKRPASVYRFKRTA